VLDAILGTSDSANIALATPPELPSAPGGDITRSPVFAVAQRRLDAATAGVAVARAERMPAVKPGACSSLILARFRRCLGKDITAMPWRAGRFAFISS
jgi:hypothetical protein